jgi:peptidoglycan hydrolase-like protein with peptidoglycan-binding domain
MTSRQDNHADLAVIDVQRRLAVLGYDLGEEAESGVYGPRTASAIEAFRIQMRMPPGGAIDQSTWILLVDSSLAMGERTLYLHMPYYQGNDVGTLQKALSALGYPCSADGIFSDMTDEAVCRFQEDNALLPDGIVAGQTFAAIDRLRHAWAGKPQVSTGSQAIRCRAMAEVLVSAPICVYGCDERTRQIAERMANLARAIASESKMLNAASLSRLQPAPMLFVGLGIEPPGHQDAAAVAYGEPYRQRPTGSLAADGRFADGLRHALGSLGGDERRVLILLGGSDGLRREAPQECGGMRTQHSGMRTESDQHCARVILEALCHALGGGA